MVREGNCVHCNGAFIRERNHNQRFCSSAGCQRERKNGWRRAKMKGDIDYQNNQKLANKRWQSKYPDYWRNYRASHPEYVERNLKAQRVRDKISNSKTPHFAVRSEEDTGNASHLAKSDALPQETLVCSGSYWLMPIGEDLAKSDALKVKITVITSTCHDKPNLAKSLLYSQTLG